MQLIDPTTGRVVWDSADPYAGPVPPAPEGRQWQVAGDMTPKAPTPQASGLDYYLGGTGIPNKLAMLNQMFNPVEAMGQSMQAGRRMLSPGRSGWDRVADAGNMLSGVAGVVAPTYAAVRGGMPAANALAETMTGISMTPQANALAGFAADESGALRLYHGSPHDFDRFSMDKIGTGEGAQAYGHGLYFAENKGVARGYRDALSGRIDVQPVAIDGVKYTPPSDQHQRVAAIIAKDGRRNAMATLRSLRDQGVLMPEQEAVWNEVLAATKGKEVTKLQSGRLYEVEVNANPEDFLDWDKPLSEQPAKVRETVAGISNLRGESGGFIWDSLVKQKNADGAFGEHMADPMPAIKTGPKAATEMLREAGIPGIKYLDAGSRGAGDGSRNYVVFDENLITIVRKYGIAGAAAMLGVSVADVEQAMAQDRQ